MRCFVNESRGYPYIAESFEFGMLYLDVENVDSAVLDALSVFSPAEEHEWTVVNA